MVVTGLDNIDKKLSNSVLTIGNFDGVHRGHQVILQETIDMAQELGCPSVAMIFEPHPVAFFNRKQPIHRIFSLPEKIQYLQQYGIDHVLVVPFNEQLATITAEQFVQDILKKVLSIKHCVVGHDFRFGKARLGDVDYLLTCGRSHGFGVTIVPAYEDNGVRISSTEVRAALQHGDIPKANQLLGHDYLISGIIESGNKKGREFGFPTANIYLRESQKLLAYGIYVVTANNGRESYPAVASYGVRPTVVDDGPAVLEVHCLDIPWTDFYNQRFEVYFHQKIRDEQNFSSIDALIEQMAKDCSQARQYFQQDNSVMG